MSINFLTGALAHNYDIICAPHPCISDHTADIRLKPTQAGKKCSFAEFKHIILKINKFQTKRDRKKGLTLLYSPEAPKSYTKDWVLPKAAKKPIINLPRNLYFKELVTGNLQTSKAYMIKYKKIKPYAGLKPIKNHFC